MRVTRSGVRRGEQITALRILKWQRDDAAGHKTSRGNLGISAG